MDVSVEKFADLQILRYHVPGFDDLSLNQKKLIYCLAEAALWGRDIFFDQNGKYNLRIRRMLEAVYVGYSGDRTTADFRALETYLKRVWFASGIHHHYGCEKFVPGFSREFFEEAVKGVARATQLRVEGIEGKIGQRATDNRGGGAKSRQRQDLSPLQEVGESQAGSPFALPLADGQTVDELLGELMPVIFDPALMPKRVNQTDGEDLVLTSACHYYEGVTQREAEEYYAALKASEGDSRPSYGLNSLLVKADDGRLEEHVWKLGGMYTEAIERVVQWLRQAMEVAETEGQRAVIGKLVDYYTTGDLRTFDEYAILWVHEQDSHIDFINGFTETYGDPLGLKASWEALVNFKDLEATRRTQLISDHAQWFEDHSPIDPRFRKTEVRGVTAKVITAAILAGDLYPATAIGINLPNADWIRRLHGSKSVSIGNITDAYNLAAHGNGFNEEFVCGPHELAWMERYGDLTGKLHTDLHECLGHGSGQLLPGVDPDALKAYGATIEEARADLFGLWYMADPKLVELGLLPDAEAYRAEYYAYLMNGLMTQLVRIQPGHQVEEAHMRNRQLIARWVYEQGGAGETRLQPSSASQGQDDSAQSDHDSAASGEPVQAGRPVVEMVTRDGKTYVVINDYVALRQLFGRLLAEVQRIKSTGDYAAARNLVERYAIRVDPKLHAEVLTRYRRLDLAPYKGFVNPRYTPVIDSNGLITDIRISYDEGYAEQMLRYSRDYSPLPHVNP